MSSVAEAGMHLGTIIGPVQPGTPLKVLFPRVARMMGWTVRRVETVWQQKPVRLSCDEMDRLRALASSSSAKNTSQEAANANRYDAIAAALEAVDPDFHGQDIARYRGIARALRSAADRREMAR